ncbi:MAG: hypothetical protein ABIZ09_13985 [Rhodoferax sp.]
MRKHIALGLTLLGICLSFPASAAGCLKGALVGGVAGHIAGKHAVVGAVGGCIVGRHMAAKKAAEEKKAKHDGKDKSAANG